MSGMSKKNNKFISFFQSVITIGVMCEGKDIDEASVDASKRLTDKEGVSYCCYDQTDFQLSGVDEWNPEFERESNDYDGFHFRFNPNDHTRHVIATRLSKKVEDLTPDDCERFVKESIDASLHA